MPKELGHWFLAERTAALIEQGPLRDAVFRNIHHFYLGAVTYDTPFYILGAGGMEELARVAPRLHGVTGEDTYEPFRQFVASYDRSGGEIPAEGLAFLAGAVTHLCGDVVFHPLVNYFCGKSHNTADASYIQTQVRHRQLEALIDVYLNAVSGESVSRLGQGLANSGRYEETVRGVAENPELTEDLIARLYWPERQPPGSALMPLLWRHARIQKQFFNNVVAMGLKALGVLGRGRAVAAATFYPLTGKRRLMRTPKESLPFFANRITYIHPNSGVEVTGSIDDFAAEAVETAAGLINSLQGHLTSDTVSEWLKGERGKSLDTGADLRKHPTPIHFDVSVPIPKLCRSR